MGICCAKPAKLAHASSSIISGELSLQLFRFFVLLSAIGRLLSIFIAMRLERKQFSCQLSDLHAVVIWFSYKFLKSVAVKLLAGCANISIYIVLAYIGYCVIWM